MSTGEQLHPNWRALATVHIPLKRFIKEGSKEVEKGTHNAQKKYHISGARGDEIKEFYEELVTTEDKKLTEISVKRKPIRLKTNNKHENTKTSFDVKSYFRFAIENKVEELKNIDFDGENINVCDDYGWSALMMASCEGAYEAVNILMALGVDRSIKDKKGRTAKDLAYKKGHFRIVDLLETNHIEPEVTMIKDKTKKPEQFYCEICERIFKETVKTEHCTSTIHQFNMKSDLPSNKLQKFNIPPRNKGLQLMLKQGWDKESGLGPSQSGRLYPVKTVIRKKRTGLGVKQDAARVTHFEPYDRKAVYRHSSDYYTKKPKNRNDIRREMLQEKKRDKRLRNALK